MKHNEIFTVLFSVNYYCRLCEQRRRGRQVRYVFAGNGWQWTFERRENSRRAIRQQCQISSVSQTVQVIHHFCTFYTIKIQNTDIRWLLTG